MAESKDVRRVVLEEMATMDRIKAFLVSGKSPVGVYLLYTSKLKEIPELPAELLAELQSEIKARLQFAWLEVRRQVVKQYTAALTARKLNQKMVLDASLKLNQKLVAVLSAYSESWGKSSKENK